jgi:AICAR transformylase/IMP cyclohydrolase PurH
LCHCWPSTTAGFTTGWSRASRSEIAAARAARDDAFGFAGAAEMFFPVEDAVQSDNSATEIREGDAE